MSYVCQSCESVDTAPTGAAYTCYTCGYSSPITYHTPGVADVGCAVATGVAGATA